MENGKLFNILGWVAMAASISMYRTYHKSVITLQDIRGILYSLW